MHTETLILHGTIVLITKQTVELTLPVNHFSIVFNFSPLISVMVSTIFIHVLTQQSH